MVSAIWEAGTTITLTEPTADDGWKFGGWVSGEATIRNNSFVMPAENVTVTAYYNAVQRPEDRKSSSSSTTFSGSSVTKTGSVFTFTNSVVIKEATLPGATSATITNKSGPGWYNFDLTAPGFTGNGSMLFQVPLDVIDIKGFTKDDVGLYHQVNGKWVLEPTYLLQTDNQYSYYKGTFDSCSPFSINFAEGVTAKEVMTTPVTEEPVKPISVEISGVSAMKVGDTTLLSAKNSDGSSAKFTGTSSDNSVATVDENGNLKAVKAGTATITVTNKVTGKTATKTITVAAKATEPTQTTKSPFPILGILTGLGVAGVFLKMRRTIINYSKKMLFFPYQQFQVCFINGKLGESFRNNVPFAES